jgi:hypothetical protein
MIDIPDPIVEVWELASYVVTVVGLPLAVMALWLESRRERANERDEIRQRDEEIYRELSAEYVDFLKIALQYPELGLVTGHPPGTRLSPLDEERRYALFGILIALFERAYILLYEEKMSYDDARRWQSWHDYMAEWCQREDLRAQLPRLLDGEDEDFKRYILRLIEEKRRPIA